MSGELMTSLRIQLLLLMVAVTAACPVLDDHCVCRYVDTPGSTRLQFITCSNMGLLGQVPAFDVSYAQTEMLLVEKNTTIVFLQSHAFAYVKARRLSLRGLEITVVDHLVFGGLEDITISVDLGDNNISHVPYDTFFRLTRLTTLRLDGNRIAALDQSTFRSMSQLQRIDLGNNLLQQLPAVIFRDLINLQILQLQGNSVVMIPEGQLANLRNVEELDLSNNRLVELSPATFASLANLKHLSLSGNNITGTLTSSFLLALGSLTKLNVSRNDILALSSHALRRCRQLVVLDLSSNRLTHIEPDSFSAVTSLQVLDLSANSLTALPPSIFQTLGDLRQLRLNKNVLQYLPVEVLIGNSHLEFFDLSFNLFESIPENLFSMNSFLEVLDLSDNVLVDIGRVLNISHLRRLDLSRNFLSELHLSTFVKNPVNIVYLDVRYNRLEGQLDGRLLSWFPRLEKFMIDSNNVTRVELQAPSVGLVHLTMSSNSLTEVPRLFHAPKLALLDVSNNYISAVSDASFNCCESLRRLRLANNRITSISDGAFRGLTLLNEIDLSDNRLSSLSTRLFASCSSLSVVNLSGNQLTMVDAGTLSGPTNLRQLDLSWNKLTSLTISSIREVSLTLVHLWVSGNPLYCDCQLTWLSTYWALDDHSTTICCPRHDFQPAVCRYVVCQSHATCPTVTANTLQVARNPLCSHTVPSSLIAVMFQQLTIAWSSTHTVDVTSVFDTNSHVIDDVTSPMRLNTWSQHEDVRNYVIALGVLLPILAISLTLAVVAIVCMRRRSLSFVDWSDEETKCPAKAVSRIVRRESDVVTTLTNTESSSVTFTDAFHVVVTPPRDDHSVINTAL